MSQERIIALIKKLKDRTFEGKIRWEKTIDEGVFQAAFPGYTVRLYKASTRVEGASGDDLILQIFNDQGELIEEISDADFFRTPAHSIVYSTLNELYSDARRIAMGVEDAVSALLSILDKDS